MGLPKYNDNNLEQKKAVKDETYLGDLRFKSLLTCNDWNSLPLAIRTRFSKRLSPNQTIIYEGEVRETRMTFMGWVFAQLARVVGAPLPVSRSIKGPAIVSVTEDGVTGGQVWTRIYVRPGRFPQVIQSAKRFAGPTGLEEYVGLGVAMRLKVSVENQALVFRSAGYVLHVGPLKLKLPSFLTPGLIEVVHREEEGAEFSFCLTVTHALFGEIIHQVAIFKENQK